MPTRLDEWFGAAAAGQDIGAVAAFLVQHSARLLSPRLLAYAVVHGKSAQAPGDGCGLGDAWPTQRKIILQEGIQRWLFGH